MERACNAAQADLEASPQQMKVGLDLPAQSLVLLPPCARHAMTRVWTSAAGVGMGMGQRTLPLAMAWHARCSAACGLSRTGPARLTLMARCADCAGEPGLGPAVDADDAAWHRASWRSTERSALAQTARSTDRSAIVGSGSGLSAGRGSSLPSGVVSLPARDEGGLAGRDAVSSSQRYCDGALSM